MLSVVAERDLCQHLCLQNIFVTGGTSQVNGFEDRLHSEVLAMRPFQSKFRVWSAGELVWSVGCGVWAAGEVVWSAGELVWWSDVHECWVL